MLRFEKSDDGRQRCSICNNSIPKGIRRISIGYHTGLSSRNHRICAKCIYNLFNSLSKEELEDVNEWNKKCMVEDRL